MTVHIATDGITLDSHFPLFSMNQMSNKVSNLECFSGFPIQGLWCSAIKLQFYSLIFPLKASEGRNEQIKHSKGGKE